MNTAALERVSPLEAYFAGRPGVWGVPHLARDQWLRLGQHAEAEALPRGPGAAR